MLGKFLCLFMKIKILIIDCTVINIIINVFKPFIIEILKSSNNDAIDFCHINGMMWVKVIFISSSCHNERYK